MKDHRAKCSVMFLALVASVVLGTAGVAQAQTMSLERQADDRPTAWMGDVVSQVEQSEYHISWRNSGSIPGVEEGYSAPNRAQDLRFVFLDDGVLATSRVSPTWVLGLHPASITVGGRTASLEGAMPTVSEDQVIYYLEGSTQTLVNRPGGLDYTLQVDDPSGEGEVMTVTFELGGDLGHRVHGTEFVELTHEGSPVLRLGPVVAHDALGTKLAVSLARGQSGELEIGVDVEDAVYPVKLDGQLKSISTSADFFMNDTIAYARMGASLATAGDVNGDGYSDVIVGFPGYDGTAGQACGMVRVYHGGPSGPGSPASPNWTVEGTLPGSKFGHSVATAGDINADGYSDIIIGAPGHDATGNNNDSGAVFVYHGTASGVGGSPAWSELDGEAGGRQGSCVATAGDVNGDGYSDVIFSVPGYDDTSPDMGLVWVYEGGSSGLGMYSSFHPIGDQANAFFGHSVATAGDVNGDGYSDVMISAPLYTHGVYTYTGEVRVYPGSSSGPNFSTYTSIRQDVSNRQLGMQLSTAGDVNGDGYADIIIGSIKSDYYEGAAYLYRGSASGIDTFYTWAAEGTTASERLGMSVATAGDVNGDGYADIILGASGAGAGGRGQAYVWLGGSGGLGPNGTAANAYWVGDADPSNGISYGETVATAGDVNGDGYSDILVGDPDKGGDNNGAVYGFYGGPDNLSDAPGWTYDSSQQSAQAGVSVATAGDVNGDGYSDFIIGAEYYDYTFTNEGAAFVWYGQDGGPSFAGASWSVYGGRNDARLGHSVATAGDVNGDGYSEIIVGAPGWANGTYKEGAVFVFNGGASGLVGTTTATAAWTAEIGDDYAEFGWSAGTAGDVNGDGYADVVIGAPGAGANSQGKAFVWLGSATGLGPDGTSANADWDWLGTTVNGMFGQSVGTAGDVNRDYYSDLIVGGDEVAVVWHGSPAGLSSSAFNWSYASAGIDDDDLGISVGTAGDTSGDGYSDVVVGAPKMDSDIFTTDDGAMLVFCGGTSGLGAGPCFTNYGGMDGANLGSSVATAGDLNGDGYSDVVAGARHWSRDQAWEGQARVYYGSFFGLWSQDWAYENNQAYSYLGHAVGTAGDVNGDGYADLLLGAPGYQATYTGEGRVSMFYGNGEHEAGTGGRSRKTQQLSPTGMPVAPQGVSTSENTIRLYHSPAAPSTGRGKVRMQSEVKVLSDYLNGTNLRNTTVFDTGTTGTSVIQDWTGLLAGRDYHWRVRVLHSPVTNPFDPPRGPWFHISTFGENEAHFQADGDSNPQQDHIFSDGFESGNLGGWDSHTP